MSLQFACHACGTRHPSRLRISKPHLLRLVMGAFGEVMEPCPLTARWVKVRIDDLVWADAVVSPTPQPVAPPTAEIRPSIPRTIAPLPA